MCAYVFIHLCMYVCHASWPNEIRYRPEIWNTCFHGPYLKTRFWFLRRNHRDGRQPQKTAVSRGFSAYLFDCNVFLLMPFHAFMKMQINHPSFIGIAVTCTRMTGCCFQFPVFISVVISQKCTASHIFVKVNVVFCLFKNTIELYVKLRLKNLESKKTLVISEKILIYVIFIICLMLLYTM